MSVTQVGSFKESRVYALMFAATLFMMSWAIIQPVYALYVQSMGANLVQLGLLLSLKSFLPLVLRIPLSIVGERIGRVRLMLVDMLIAVTAAVLYSLASSFIHLILIVLLESLASASFNQTAMSTVSDLSPPGRQGNTMGRYLTFLAIGMLGGPAFCAVLISFLSYSQLFLLSASFPLLGLVLLSLRSPHVPRLNLDEDGGPEVGAMDSLRMIFRNRNVMLLSFCRLSFSVTQALFLALFSVYLDDMGIRSQV
ncbi:MAG: MFS transporter [Candidatus Bathyarchaeia archaeon]